MKPVIADHDERPLTYGKYISGFLGSVALTLCAYWLATHGRASSDTLAIVLAALAISQFVLQMLLFLHVGEEHGPRWRLAAAGCMLAVVLILVLGSIWIMDNLNYRMTPQQILKYMQSQDNL